MCVRQQFINFLKQNISCETVDNGFYQRLDLDECMKRVKENLTRIHILDNCSAIFINQLIALQQRGYIEINNSRYRYHPQNIYLRIESLLSGKIKPQLFNKKKSLLRGNSIYHIHHGINTYFEKNQIRCFERKYEDDHAVMKRLDEYKTMNPDINPWLMLYHEIEIATENDSDNWGKRTGEWIVFQKIDDKYKFLCLAVHEYDSDKDKTDATLYNLIKDHLV